MTRAFWIFLLFCLFAPAVGAEPYLLIPDRVLSFDPAHPVPENSVVLVDGGKITAVGPRDNITAEDATVIRLEGQTLLPGLIEGHSHILLHPYDETAWNDQVLVESWAERTLRAGNHLKAHLMAGFTTLRDLGTEGAGYSDIGIRDALQKGVIEGPRFITAGPAIVAKGSYGPKGFAAHVKVPLGAEEATSETLESVVRDQIGHGVDLIKIYADYRWGPDGEARPTFSEDDIRRAVEIAERSGRYVVAHAQTPEGMMNAIHAGVQSIEHGGTGGNAPYQLMAERNIFWCPTIGAVEATSQYAGWGKGIEPAPERLATLIEHLAIARDAGTPMCMGSDVGVFDHGDSAWEMELMVEYGFTAAEALKAATYNNARMLGMEGQIGTIAPGMIADLIAVEGNPLEDISALRTITMVMQNGKHIK